ncbi:MAG: tyrosine--tRNA ligase, partial [Candidatus Eremiobacteraeota bacterium]|nr:tyrosine--tRNA ligase [Candidatus Eremiobacteraeota bacterium]
MRGDEALPNHRVKAELVTFEHAGDERRRAENRSRADRFVSVLCALAHFVQATLGKGLAVRVDDVGPSGGTGLIGDPSGRSSERQLLTKEMTDANLQGIRIQLERFLDFSAVSNPAKIINNAEWLVPIRMVDFMRDVGKHFTVNYMLAKDSVDRRIGSEDGISFTEFSYMLLQAYDYLMLAQHQNCTLQMGGSDQWGNITAGIDLIRKVTGKHAHALVVPLITNAAGAKFGKTEGGP